MAGAGTVIAAVAGVDGGEEAAVARLRPVREAKPGSGRRREAERVVGPGGHWMIVSM